MEQLVNLVMEKTGLGEEAATQAVDIVLSFIKEKLPEPLAAQVEGLLGDGGEEGGIGGALKGMLGG